MELGQIIVIAFNAFILLSYTWYGLHKYSGKATVLYASMALKINQVIRLFLYM